MLIFYCQILAYHRCIPLDSYLKNPGGELKASASVKVIVLPKGPSLLSDCIPRNRKVSKVLIQCVL